MVLTTLDADFEITDAMRKWAESDAPTVNLDREHGRFCDYWLANGKKMSSWEACWRNWMRRAPQMGGVLYTNDELRIKKLMADYTAKGFRRAYTHENSLQYQAAFESQALAKLPQRDMSNILQLAGAKRV